jgi:hypothetical protein
MHQSGWTYLLALGVVGIFVLAFWLLGKLLPRKAHTGAGNALMRLDVFYNPSRQYVIEARSYEEKQDEESGDPPEPGVR